MKTAMLAALGVAMLSAWKGEEIVDEVKSYTPSFEAFDELFKKYGREEGVPWRVLKAFAMNESSLGDHPSVAAGLANPNDPASVSEDGKSWGLMQLTIPTANDYENVGWPDLNNAETSVRIAAKFIAHLWSIFGGEIEWVVKAYNEGEGNARKERDGKIAGYAGTYWERWQRNFNRVLARQPGDALERG